jgi:tripartite motif-containing protein 71
MLHRKQVLVILIASLLLAGCAAPRGLLRPNGVAVAPDGSVYVMDRGNYRVVHLSATGKFLGAFGKLGAGPNDIYAGWDIALDSAGNVYICNQVPNEEGTGLVHDGVKVFAPSGRLVRELGGQDYVYGDDVVRNTPYGVDIDAQGRIYVADFGADTVRVFDPQGGQIAQFFGDTGSEEDQFYGVNDVAVDDPRGLMYVVDNMNSRVQQFSLAVTDSGELTVTHLLSFGEYGREPGQFAYLQNIAVDDASGRVYVGDMANYRVQVFDTEGNYVSQFSPPDVEIWQVMGLAVGSDGAVYVADARNNAVWVFEPDGRLRSRIEVEP